MHLVTYDLKMPGRNYDNLYHAIKSLGDWTHPLESVWLVQSRYTAGQIYQVLTRHLDKNDLLFVVKMDAEYQGQLEQSVWNWLKFRIAA